MELTRHKVHRVDRSGIAGYDCVLEQNNVLTASLITVNTQGVSNQLAAVKNFSLTCNMTQFSFYKFWDIKSLSFIKLHIFNVRENLRNTSKLNVVIKVTSLWMYSTNFNPQYYSFFQLMHRTTLLIIQLFPKNIPYLPKIPLQ